MTGAPVHGVPQSAGPKSAGPQSAGPKSAGPLLLGADGKPLPRIRQHRAPMADTAFTAGSRVHPDLADWTPWLSSADADVLGTRDTVAARVHDIARNDGWASGALQKHLDNVIGGGLRLAAKPDFRALGMDSDWAAEWSRNAEARWRTYADDPGFYCDAARQSTMAGVFARAYRHRLLDGGALAVLLWLPSRGGRYATTVQVVDPDRLSNPHDGPDTDTMRGGVEIGDHGEARAFHIRRHHPGDHFGLMGTANTYVWDRVERETAWGRPLMIHDFEADRAGQSRARSPLAPILKKLRMLGRYDETEMQAALVNSIFAAFIESSFDQEMVSQALETNELTAYQAQREAFHDASRLRLSGGARIPILYPGEKFNFPVTNHPNAVFSAFEETALRNVATALGLSYEQLSMDWSKTNYSSARAALMEVWKFFTARRTFFCAQFAQQVYIAWLEEAIDLGDIETPPGAPDFLDARAAYARARWIGPPRGWIDPVKEAQAAQLRMEMGLSTLEQEAADQGLDWEEVLHQRRRELDLMDELNIPRPSWADIGALTAPSDAPAEGAPK